MLIIDQASPEDISYIAKISESVFSIDILSAPDNFMDPNWYFDASSTGYLYKIIFNDEIIGGFVVFRFSTRKNFSFTRIPESGYR